MVDMQDLKSCPKGYWFKSNSRYLGKTPNGLAVDCKSIEFIHSWFDSSLTHSIVINNNFLNKEVYVEFRLKCKRYSRYSVLYYATNIWTKPIRLAIMYLSLYYLNYNILYVSKLTNSFFFSKDLFFFLYKRRKHKKD